MTTSCVLVTGGAGYIGSHTVLALLQAGRDVVVLDNLCNASEESLRRVERIAGRKVRLLRGDVRDAALLTQVFSDYPFDVEVMAIFRPSRRSQSVASRAQRERKFERP